MDYKEFRERQQKEFSEFPMMFAFNNKQFDEGMDKLGLDPANTDKVYNFNNTGGFYRRTDSTALWEMITRHKDEFDTAIKEDIDGDKFILEMFKYELANHEYGYSMELDDALDSLGLTMEEIEAAPNLLKGLQSAIASYKA